MSEPRARGPRCLAAASDRLREVPGFPGRPGRPRKSPGEGPAPRDAPASVAVVSRLLDVETAAAYLGVSPWTVRDLEAAGTLARVRVPLPGGRELRKLLFDRADLDRLIDVWKR